MSGSNGTTNGKPHRAAVLGTVRGPDPERLRAALVLRHESVGPVRESTDFPLTFIDPLERWRGLGDFLPMGGWWGAGYGFPQERSGRLQPAPAGMLSETELRGAIVFSRWLCERNHLAVGFLGHVTNFTYGDGAEWEVTLRGTKPGAVSTGVTDADGDGSPDSDPAVKNCQAYLEEWRKASGWGEGADHFDFRDLDGADRTPRTDRQAESGRRGSRDGNALVRFFKGGSGDEGLPSVRFVEPELIRNPPGEPQPEWYEGSVKWSWGVATDADDSETVVAYGVADPDNVTSVEVVPAGRIAHLKLNVDGTVNMGVPDFFCVSDSLEDTRKLLLNLVKVAVEQAAITIFTEHAEGVTKTQIDSMIDTNKDYSAPRLASPYGGVTTRATRFVDPGQEVHISNGQKVTPGPVANSAPLIAVEQAQLRAVGMRWGCPEYFSGDASNANFASTLVAGGPFERMMKRRQKDVGIFEQAVAMRVLAFGVASGRLSEDEVRRVTVEVRFPSVAIANKAEDSSRRTSLVGAGLMSPQTAMSEEGLDPAVELANIQAHSQATQPQPQADPFGGGSPFGESVREAVTWVAGQHPRDRKGEFIKKNEVDDAKAAYKRGDKAPMEALRARVRPEDKALLDAHLAHDPHAGDARAHHPGAQKAGAVRTLGWKAGNQLVDHVGGVLDKVESDGPLSPEATRDLVVHVGTFLRSKRIPELQNILRAMNVPHAEFVGKGKEELQKLAADKVKVALWDAEFKYHARASDPERQPAGRELAHAESVAVEGEQPTTQLPPPGSGHPLDAVGEEILAALGVGEQPATEAHGAPPHPGLVFDDSSHRWTRPDESPTGSHNAPGTRSAAAVHPKVIEAAKRLGERAGALAATVNAKLLALNLTPAAVVGDQSSWETWFVTQHADLVAAHLGVDSVTAMHVLTHLAAHAIDLVKRHLSV